MIFKALSSCVLLGLGMLLILVAGIASGSAPTRDTESPEAAPAAVADPPYVLCLEGQGATGQRCALVDVAGHLLRPPELFSVSLFQPDGKGGFITAAQDESGGWGYLAGAGAWVVKPRLEAALRHGEDGLARFQREGRWGFIDREGKEVVAPSFTYARPFDLGLAPVETSRGWSYISTKGEVTIKGPFRAAGAFSAAGFAPVAPKKGKKLGYIDRSGKLVIPARFDAALPFGPGGTAPVAIEKELTYRGEKLDLRAAVWGLIDSTGQWILEPRYSSIHEFDAAGLAAFQDLPPGEFGENGYLDAAGKVVMAARDLARVRHCDLVRENYASTRFLGPTGKLAIEKRFLWASHFTDDCFALARDGETWGILHHDGRFIALGSEYREPLTDADGGLIDWGRPGGLIPVLTAEGGVAYLDRSGKERFRFTWKESDASTTVSLIDHRGEKLWSNPSANSPLIRPRAHLTPDAREHFNDPAYLDGDLAAVVKRLQAEEARAFYPVSLIFDDRQDAYDLDELRSEYADEELAEMLRHGAVETLAQAYVSPHLWSRFQFLDSATHDRFKSYFEHLTARLTKAFGSPPGEVSVDYLRWGDGNDHQVWALGDRYLVLELQSESGDGDIAYQLWLAVIDAGQ